MSLLSNRHLYATGRATGPSRLIRLTMAFEVDGANPAEGVVPIILGNVSGRSNFWRRVTSTYGVVYNSRIITGNTNNVAVISRYDGQNKSNNPLAVSSTFINTWANSGMSYEEFLDYEWK